MKKDEIQYIKWIRQMYDKYKSILFIEKYHFKVEKTKKEAQYLASEFNYPYLDAKILWSDESLKDWKENREDAERRLIHELCHTITDPLYSKTTNVYVSKSEIEDERERLTDHIAQIVNKHFTKLSK